MASYGLASGRLLQLWSVGVVKVSWSLVGGESVITDRLGVKILWYSQQYGEQGGD